MTVFLLLQAFIWTADASSGAYDGGCGQSELSESEISECVTNGKNCNAIGAFSNRVQTIEDVGAKADQFRNQEPKRSNAQPKPSLIYFEVVDPVSVRFSGKGYKKLFLFEIDGRRVSAAFRCVRDATKVLSPGHYILQGYHDMEFLNAGNREFRLSIEPVSIASDTQYPRGNEVLPSEDIEGKGKQSDRESGNIVMRGMRAGILVGLVGIVVGVLVILSLL